MKQYKFKVLLEGAIDTPSVYTDDADALGSAYVEFTEYVKNTYNSIENLYRSMSSLYPPFHAEKDVTVKVPSTIMTVSKNIPEDAFIKILYAHKSDSVNDAIHGIISKLVQNSIQEEYPSLDQIIVSAEAYDKEVTYTPDQVNAYTYVACNSLKSYLKAFSELSRDITSFNNESAVDDYQKLSEIYRTFATFMKKISELYEMVYNEIVYAIHNESAAEIRKNIAEENLKKHEDLLDTAVSVQEKYKNTHGVENSEINRKIEDIEEKVIADKEQVTNSQIDYEKETTNVADNICNIFKETINIINAKYEKWQYAELLERIASTETCEAIKERIANKEECLRFPLFKSKVPNTDTKKYVYDFIDDCNNEIKNMYPECNLCFKCMSEEDVDGLVTLEITVNSADYLVMDKDDDLIETFEECMSIIDAHLIGAITEADEFNLKDITKNKIVKSDKMDAILKKTTDMRNKIMNADIKGKLSQKISPLVAKGCYSSLRVASNTIPAMKTSGGMMTKDESEKTKALVLSNTDMLKKVFLAGMITSAVVLVGGAAIVIKIVTSIGKLGDKLSSHTDNAETKSVIEILKKVCSDIVAKFSKVKNESFELTEATLNSEDRSNLDNDEFGIPETRSYPLTDKEHIRKAIQMFHYAKEQYRNTLAKNICSAIINKKYVGQITISDDNKYKSYFPKWMLTSSNAKAEYSGNSFKIIVNGKIVHKGTLKEKAAVSNESVAFNPLTGHTYM